MTTSSAQQTLATSLPGDVLGTVEGIYVTPDAGAPMRAVESAKAVEDRGLEGDRYFARVGAYSKTPGTGRHLTMIDAAAIESVEQALGHSLAPGVSRRNLVVRGVELSPLIGKRFWIGEALCEGMRDCPPCGHLESLAGSGVAKALIGRGGLRVEIRQGGTIRVGDKVKVEG